MYVCMYVHTYKKYIYIYILRVPPVIPPRVNSRVISRDLVGGNPLSICFGPGSTQGWLVSTIYRVNLTPSPEFIFTNQANHGWISPGICLGFTYLSIYFGLSLTRDR